MFAPRYSYALWSRTRARLGGAMPSDLLGPPGRCSGCWPHDSMVRSPAAPSPILFSDFRFGATMELDRSGRPMLTSASPGRGGGDGDGAGRAQLGRGPRSPLLLTTRAREALMMAGAGGATRAKGWRATAIDGIEFRWTREAVAT
jgi:hypothetical protein